MTNRTYHRLGHDGLALAGIAGVVYGVAMWSIPAAVISTGVFLLLAGLWWAWAAAQQALHDKHKRGGKH